MGWNTINTGMYVIQDWLKYENRSGIYWPTVLPQICRKNKLSRIPVYSPTFENTFFYINFEIKLYQAHLTILTNRPTSDITTYISVWIWAARNVQKHEIADKILSYEIPKREHEDNEARQVATKNSKRKRSHYFQRQAHKGKCSKHPLQSQGTLYMSLSIFIYIFIPLDLEGKGLAYEPLNANTWTKCSVS